MKILLLATHFNPGGITRYCLNLAKGLKQLGHDVSVASSGGEWVAELEHQGIKHKFIPIKTKSILSPKIVSSVFEIYPFIKENAIEIVHGNTRVTQMLAFYLHLWKKVPYVSTFHGFYNPRVFRRTFKLAGLRAIAVSGAVAKHLSRDLNIDQRNIRVVHNGIDAAQFNVEDVTSDLGFKKGDLVLGILGRISKEKGQFLAVEAIERLRHRYLNIRLAICGKGRLEEELKDLIKRRKVSDIVNIVDTDADSFLSRIDLLLVPSHKEGFGYAILEAFVKGVAVIGFNVGGISEIITDKKNGVLFYDYSGKALSEAIDKVLSDGRLRSEIIEGARKSVSSFSLENMASKTEQVYKEVLR